MREVKRAGGDAPWGAGREAPRAAGPRAPAWGAGQQSHRAAAGVLTGKQMSPRASARPSRRQLAHSGTYYCSASAGWKSPMGSPQDGPSEAPATCTPRRRPSCPVLIEGGARVLSGASSYQGSNSITGAPLSDLNTPKGPPPAPSSWS